MSITRKGARTAIRLLVDRIAIAKKTTRYAKRISTTAAEVEISVEIAYADRIVWSWIKPIPVNRFSDPVEDKIDGIADPAEL